MESHGVFVGDLSYFCTEQDLYQLFSPFGNIDSVMVRRGKAGDTLHYGFVKMDDASAQKALVAMQGHKYMGRKLRLNLLSHNNQCHSDKSKWSQIHVSFLAKSVRHQINEEYLDRLFSRSGLVADCVIKQYRVEVNPHKQSGYGFVYFVREEEALSAMRAFKNKTFDGVQLDCNFSSDADAAKYADRFEDFYRGPSSQSGLMDKPRRSGGASGSSGVMSGSYGPANSAAVYALHGPSSHYVVPSVYPQQHQIGYYSSGPHSGGLMHAPSSSVAPQHHLQQQHQSRANHVEVHGVIPPPILIPSPPNGGVSMISNLGPSPQYLSQQQPAMSYAINMPPPPQVNLPPNAFAMHMYPPQQQQQQSQQSQQQGPTMYGMKYMSTSPHYLHTHSVTPQMLNSASFSSSSMSSSSSSPSQAAFQQQQHHHQQAAHTNNVSPAVFANSSGGVTY